jgi:hypothetical protein
MNRWRHSTIRLRDGADRGAHYGSYGRYPRNARSDGSVIEASLANTFREVSARQALPLAVVSSQEI